MFFWKYLIDKSGEFFCDKLKVTIEEYLKQNKLSEYKLIIRENLKNSLELKIGVNKLIKNII